MSSLPIERSTGKIPDDSPAMQSVIGPRTDENSIIASVKSVSRSFNGKLALDGVSFNLRAGEIVALLGPNGAGKTTFIRILLGLTRASAGYVSVFGHEAGAQGARARIGTLLQVGTSSVPEHLRVMEHIDLFRSYYSNPLTPNEIIEMAGLGGLEKRQFGKLSGGEKQRLLFALAICGNPDLLFLDEPTVGMDVEARRLMWRQIRRFAAAGKTILLTTHYLEEADELADRIVLLKDGKIIAEGSPEEIKIATGKRLIRCRTSLSHADLLAIESVESVLAEGDRMVVVSPSPEVVIRTLLTLDPNLADLQTTDIALEDAFVSLTRHSQSA